VHADTMTVKPVTTRKLRRRPNDPLPVPEKRGKPSPDILLVHRITYFSNFQPRYSLSEVSEMLCSSSYGCQNQECTD